MIRLKGSCSSFMIFIHSVIYVRYFNFYSCGVNTLSLSLCLSLSLFHVQRCFDGGFTSNVPCSFDSDVITVSPFSGGCDICPQGESGCMQHVHFGDQPFQISSKNLYRLLKSLNPTSWEELEELFQQGYSDALRFFRQEGKLQY